MTEKIAKPQLRFAGFDDTWEQRKLGEVGTTYTGLSGKTKEDFGHGNGQFVTYMNVFSNPVGLPDMTEAVEIDDSQNKVLFGDVLFTTSSETPEEVGMSSVWLENAENTYLNSFCFGYRPTVEFNPYYLAYMLRSSSMRKKITFLAQGISRYNISKNKMMDIEIPIPKIEEQKQIGSYFRNLDNLITLHQRKYDKLTNVKKSMLEKMFPKNGSNVPEIRFKGFSDAWEQRKVTELGKIYIGLVTTMTKHYTNEGTLLIRNSDIKDGRFEFGDTPIYLENTFAQENESRMHQIGDVITVHTGDVGTSAVITENEAKSIGFATIVTRPDTQIIVPNYLCTFLNTDKHKRWAVAISTGDGRTNYNLGDYYELVVPVPSIREQQAISSFVQNLNNLITLHQRESTYFTGGFYAE